MVLFWGCIEYDLWYEKVIAPQELIKSPRVGSRKKVVIAIHRMYHDVANQDFRCVCSKPKHEGEFVLSYSEIALAKTQKTIIIER